VLGSRIFTDQHDVLASHVYAFPTLPFDVLLVFRVKRLLELAVTEIKINVLVFFPSEHQPVATYVGAAEPYEGPRQAHFSPYFRFARSIGGTLVGQCRRKTAITGKSRELCYAGKLQSANVGN
jgi:hypothetical protein